MRKKREEGREFLCFFFFSHARGRRERLSERLLLSLSPSSSFSFSHFNRWEETEEEIKRSTI